MFDDFFGSCSHGQPSVGSETSGLHGFQATSGHRKACLAGLHR
jgi:hypothetical protein